MIRSDFLACRLALTDFGRKSSTSIGLVCSNHGASLAEVKKNSGSQICGPQVCELPIFCVHWVNPRRSLPGRPCVQTLAQERFPLIEARSAVAAVRACIPGIIRKTYSAPITALLISFRYFSVRPLMYFCVFCAALVSTPTSLYISVNPWFCSV